MRRKERVSGKRPDGAARGKVAANRQPAAASRMDAIPVEAALIAANEYCLRHYAVAYTAGTPRRLLLPTTQVWVIPVVLTSPGYGAVGEVGMMAVDAFTREVIGATPRPEVLAAGARLAGEKRDELDAAFRRARTV